MLARTLRPLTRPAARCAASAAGVSSPPPPPFDPENTASSFAPFSTADLAVTAAMLRVCAYPALMRASRRLLEASFEFVAAANTANSNHNPSSHPPWSPLLALPAAALLGAVKATVFPHYCAGESLADCRAVGDKMARNNVRLIVDHSVEERETPDAWAENLAAKGALLRRVGAELEDRVAMIPVKVTALASPAMLLAVTAVLRAQGAGWQDRPLRLAEVRAALAARDTELLDSAIVNLSALCEQAVAAGVPLLMDAERDALQPAVDLVVMELMRRFNPRGGGGGGGESETETTPAKAKAYVYNTYQMYLADSLRRLQRDMEASEGSGSSGREEKGSGSPGCGGGGGGGGVGGFTFAAKVVRGAYQVQERAAAAAEARPCPVFERKGQTDEAYNEAVRRMLGRIHASGDGAAIVVATHNRRSVELAVARMEQLGLPRDHAGVHVAQIMGICDNVTCALGAAGYNALKLVLFGDYHEIFPWLLRRLDENSDLMGAPLLESPLVTKELRRRMGL